jgi:HPr kinase/phosphorylase
VQEIRVNELIERVSGPLDIEVLAGANGAADRAIRAARIQKPGLALAGYSAFVHPDRVQVLGQTEISYLASIGPAERERAVATLTALNLACVLVTKGLTVPSELVAACARTSTPLLRTPIVSSEAIRKLIAYLDDLLSPRTSVHGVLVDVNGVGILMTGASGVGKSECALELVLRGHRLVADDVVEIRRRGEDLVGQASDLIRNLIEIRGLGILNVAELYGVAATRDHKRIELHVELEEWRPDRIYERIGLDHKHYDLLGARIPSLLVPVRTGRSMTAIIEVAARNVLLRLRGHNAAETLSRRMAAVVQGADPELLAEALPESPATEPKNSLRSAAYLAEALDHLEDEIE